MSTSIQPHQLPSLLAAHPKTKVLSLDCFDTLLWRNTHQPVDVFTDLVSGGVSSQQRIFAEKRARTAARIDEERQEVSIGEIYRALMPNADEAAQAAAASRELAAEARHCFPFAPTVELMKAAKERGLEIIIVSDTYLDEAQLRDLLRTAAGEDVLRLIDRIFCSSHYGKPKGAGLFTHVLDALDVQPEDILHLGDNRNADLVAPSALGITAYHLVQFDEDTVERLRLEVAGASIFDSDIRHRLPAYQPHRPALSIAQPTLADGATALGYAALGPVFYGFARWLEEEAREIEARTGKPVHMLFLMRDGHLPKLVFDAMSDGTIPSSTGEISRLTSSAATLATESGVLRYAKVAVLSGYQPEYTLSRLLFPKEEIQRILRRLPGGPQRGEALMRHIRKPQTLRLIMKRSQDLADRMVEHVRSRTAIEPGETLMLVDLGYNGSVQNRAEPVLREGLGVNVVGRYLLLREAEISGLDKKGFIDNRRYDERALDALCSAVAVIEQLSTISQGSVIDYKPDGSPIRKASHIAAEQSRVRDSVQAACVQFARDWPQASHRRPASDDAAWHHAAVASLIRLMFLPTAKELATLSAFEHDINLGTDAAVKLFDPEIAARELKRRGPFYLKHSNRMYLPAELRGQGLPLTLAMMTSWRFSLDLNHSEFADREISLPVMIADGTDVVENSVRATPTHEGHFVAAIPVGAGRFAIGVQFAKLYEWLQIEAAWFVPAETVLNPRSTHASHDSAANYVLEGIEEPSPGLLKCNDPAGFLMVPPPATRKPMVLHIAFRPIMLRAAAAAAQPHKQVIEAVAQ